MKYKSGQIIDKGNYYLCILACWQSKSGDHGNCSEAINWYATVAIVKKIFPPKGKKLTKTSREPELSWRDLMKQIEVQKVRYMREEEIE